MSPSSRKNNDLDCHFAASGIAAIINFPLWRASAIAQSGFKLEGSNIFVKYYKAVFQPPYRGVVATIFGMTWARAGIFYGSEYSTSLLIKSGFGDGALSHLFPPLVLGTIVQVINMPLVRATITIQDPSSTFPNVRTAMVYIYKTRGISGLWHGVSAGILKTVPKYMTAVGVKDLMEERLPRPQADDKQGQLTRSAIKSVSAGLAGAILTNPIDVLRNEMFKTDLSIGSSLKKLLKEEGWNFGLRGMTANMTAVAIPIAITIFATDLLIGLKHI